MTELGLAVNAFAPEPAKTANEQEGLHALQWQEQNREAIRSSNSYVEATGLPLAKVRLY